VVLYALLHRRQVIFAGMPVPGGMCRTAAHARPGSGDKPKA
jgi:hypothetical protein